MTDVDLQYTMNDARYAKNMVALHIPGIDGWKSTAASILTFEVAPNARHSGRERAYIVSRAQASRFVKAVEDCKARRAAAREVSGTKNPNLAELDRLSQDRYDRPFVELDVDKRMELEEEVRDALGEVAE